MHACSKAQSNRVSVLVFIYNLQLSKREELSVLLLLLLFRLDFWAPARGKSERLITRRFITLSDPCAVCARLLLLLLLSGSTNPKRSNELAGRCVYAAVCLDSFFSFIKCPETFSFLQLRWDCGPQPKWECVGDTLEISYIASSSSSSSPLPSRLFYSFFSSFLSATSLPKLSPSSKEQQITGLLPLPLVYLFIDMTRAYASQMRDREL